MPGLVENAQVGRREDLADIYAIVDMKSTPFCTRVNKSSKPTKSDFDWIVDAYAAVKTNGTVDGTDVADYENHAENRARLGNYAQTFRRTAKVSRLSENLSNVAGVRSEIALAAQKKLVEIKRDMETTFLLNDRDGQADNGSVPYLTSSIGKWINPTTGGTFTPPTLPRNMASSPQSSYNPASAQIVTAATNTLSEDTHIQDLLKNIYDATGMNGDFVLFAGSTLRRRFTDMTRTSVNSGSTNTLPKIRTFTLGAATTTVSNSTTLYEGDYGSVEVVSSNFIGNDYATGGQTGKNVGYVLDMNKIHLRSLSKPGVERFPDLGGGPRILIEAVCGLQVDNPIGLGAFKPTS